MSKHRLRRLYESHARGLLDEDLLDEVGMMLWMRCRDILTIRRARRGEVLCPQCDRDGVEALIPRTRHARQELLACPVCGWQITWVGYAGTYKRRQLHSGGAVGAFTEFVKRYPAARSPQEKMLAIDRLIHEFHYSLPSDPTVPSRAVGVNLITGRLTDVVAFLDELSGLGDPDEAITGTHQAWREKIAAIPWGNLLG